MNETPKPAPPPSARDLLGLAGRLAAGGVFVYAAFMKLSYPAEEFAFAIETYKVVPAALALLAARTVPWIELFLGVFLAAGLYTRLAALGTGAMLAFFELLLAQAWLRGLPVKDCGCFGAGGGNPLWAEFLLNLAWIGFCWAAWRFGAWGSLDRYLEKK